MENNQVNSKCPNCGSTLVYDPETRNLKCVSCSSVISIESLGRGKLDEEEQDYFAMVNELRETKLEKKMVSSLNCDNCGASLMHDGNTTSTVCPFCGSSHIIEKNVEEEVIPIAGVVPFNMDKKECNKHFHNWIKGKFFAPSAFKNSRFELDLYPIYLPFWTFDMECYTEYRAERGDYYYVTVEKEDINGNKRRERERRTRWSYRSGHCHNSFDDIMVLGSTNQRNYYYINRVAKYDFNNMEKFNPQFLIGYQGEKISLPLEEGFMQAKQSVKWKIENTIEHDVGGDEVRILHMHTMYDDVTFKQVLVPVYNGLYSYNGKQYHFVMNGQTGKFAGGAPVSAIKVTAFVLAILAFVIAIIFVFANIA